MTTVTVPAGTWIADPVHSSIGFTIDHMRTSTFRSNFTEYEIALRDGLLEGVVQVGSITIGLQEFKTHMLSPDFFDVERTPTLEFRSTTIDVADGGSLAVEGELTVKGTTKPMTASGKLFGPLEGLNGRNRVGIELTTTADRFDFGINFDMKMPGDRAVVGRDVTIQIVLEMIEQK